tara:strand:- start:1557 stop:1955 length:399 start_codon:yes stop_codon:yes gene_type:complete
LQEPKKIHGINFLENREKILIVKKTNQNDVVKLIGKPHIISISEPNKWIYFQRTITRGKMHKLGRNVLKENNVLELDFDKYGVLKKKKLYKKEDMNKVVYSKNETKNEVTQKSFVGKFLSSIKQKMYGKRKF